jgi:hypothetical protein
MWPWRLQGFEMIRYADDLAIPCRKENEARQALVLLGKRSAGARTYSATGQDPIG